MKKEVNFEDLLAKTLVSIDISRDKDEITFRTSDNEVYRMYHSQNCCESVAVDDVEGDLNYLLNTPILVAEETTNSEDVMGRKDLDSFTWTFYKLATIKGYVTIRWLGESNGYYSESVSFVSVTLKKINNESNSN